MKELSIQLTSSGSDKSLSQKGVCEYVAFFYLDTYLCNLPVLIYYLEENKFVKTVIYNIKIV